MGQTDRQTDDGHQCIMPQPCGGGGGAGDIIIKFIQWHTVVTSEAGMYSAAGHPLASVPSAMRSLLHRAFHMFHHWLGPFGVNICMCLKKVPLLIFNKTSATA